MRSKSETKKQEFVEAAGELFLGVGYSAVSMAAIAARAGGSRVTLYGYFPTKEAIFEAFIIEAGRERAAVMEGLTGADHETQDAKPRLTALGISYLKLRLDPKVLAINRLITGEALRFPESARIFYERGPKVTLCYMCKVIESLSAKGELRHVRSMTLAWHFKALCDATLYEKQLWAVEKRVSDRQIREAVASAVEAFLHGYGKS